MEWFNISCQFWAIIKHHLRRKLRERTNNNTLYCCSQDQAISGVTAGCVSTLFMHPLDLVKAKLQVQVTSKGNGLLYQLRNIAKQDGLRGLYRGLGVNILGNCRWA